ncbi:MAG: Asp-tRNA(Asn)/Glu-tRNA(Gln) amidotransferase subunit GatB [bacterium]|nr:Asp-tRNA(Asn)/Glu-tRNA(Gln) amidotransferase subunit GatB [bacterium]
MKLESIIGLEIHVQLKTKSKMFCGCQNGVEAPPNSAICPVCMGHPGTLPVPNKAAIDMGAIAALAINCTIGEESKFDRKNYFYPDLPKGYQISQYDKPIGVDGYVEVQSQKLKVKSRVGIIRLHLEEDAAKLIHGADGKHSLVDFNRAGTPLAEIVTKPDLRSPAEAKTFLHALRLILRYCNISDADMEKGQLRCDANISLRPLDKKDRFFTKTEVKNMNSFKSVERALEYEIQRQTKLWENHTPPTVQTTRGWNDEKGITEEQRLKEEAHDYRFFPEPDIPPLRFTKEYVERMRAKIPELPRAKHKRFIDQFDMDPTDIAVILEDKKLADWTEQTIGELREWLVALEGEGTEEERWERDHKRLVKLVTGWITTKLFKLMNETKTTSANIPITPENFAEFITFIYQNKINSTVAQEVLEAMFKEKAEPHHYIEEKKLAQVSDEDAIGTIVTEVLDEQAEAVATYKKGKHGALQFLIGQVMKKMKGKANPIIVEKLLKKSL